ADPSTDRRVVDRRSAGARGRAVAQRLHGALYQPGRDAADPLRDDMAPANRPAAPARDGAADRPPRPRGGLRVGGGVQPRLQARVRGVTGTLARRRSGNGLTTRTTAPPRTAPCRSA